MAAANAALALDAAGLACVSGACVPSSDEPLPRRQPRCASIERASDQLWSSATGSGFPTTLTIDSVSHESRSDDASDLGLLQGGLINTRCSGVDERGEVVSFRQPGGILEDGSVDATCNAPRFCRVGHTYDVVLTDVAATGLWTLDPGHVVDVTALVQGVCEGVGHE